MTRGLPVVTASVIPPYFFVFDVETVGLQGEPFAVGWVVIDSATEQELESGIIVSAFERALLAGSGRRPPLQRDIDWCKAHVLPAIAGVPVSRDIRRPFWDAWKQWEAKGALLAADVPWPCEARFLMECVCWMNWMGAEPVILPGPYPLIDVASVRLATGFDPLATNLRFDDEEPAHNPLADARQSARLLLEALRR